MPISIEKSIDNLRKRRTDPETGKTAHFESLQKSYQVKAAEDRMLRYIEQIFEDLPDEYLRKTFEECERVRSQIEKAASNESIAIEFAYQGSVTNGTAIKVSSDIDLLVVHGHFYSLAQGLEATTPYRGSPKDEILKLRKVCKDRLSTSFPRASVDDSGAKCISINGGTLARKVDVIPALWHHTERYIQNNFDPVFRGIRIFDRLNSQFIDNFPFLHNAMIGLKDMNTGGKFTSLVRAVKNIRDDAPDWGYSVTGVSSYGIASLTYHIPDDEFLSSTSPVELLMKFVSFTLKLMQDQSRKSQILVPNKSGKIFESMDEDGLFNLIKATLELAQAGIRVMKGSTF